MDAQVFVGLVVRDHAIVLLRRAVLGRSDEPEAVEYEELNKQHVSAAARSLISEQQLAVLQVDCPAPVHVLLTAPGPWVVSFEIAACEQMGS